jgi:hypothetical protein
MSRKHADTEIPAREGVLASPSKHEYLVFARKFRGKLVIRSLTYLAS